MTSTESLAASQDGLLKTILTSAKPLSDPALEVYRRNIEANAVRALQISFPTLEQLVGKRQFASFASAYLHSRLPDSGDWGQWGEHFPAFVAGQKQLTAYPYLADCGKLDWLRHLCERARDQETDIESLTLLSEVDPYALKLELKSCVACLSSDFPVLDIFLAHQESQETAEKHRHAAKEKLAERQGQALLVYRPQWRSQLRSLTVAERTWLQELMSGTSVGGALDQVADLEFDFSTWLPQAMQEGLLYKFTRLDTP